MVDEVVARRRSGGVVRILTAALCLALFAAACGDDGESSSADPGENPGGSEPAQGGSATILLYSEQASMDPARFTGSGSSDAQRAFAVYGALVGMNATTGEVDPILAESLTPNDDFTGWTLVLRDGLLFSDGSPFDADAVRVNWERIQDPASRSPGLALATSIASMEAIDARTLQITLKEPNAHFDNGVSRQALNYIASAEAISSGHDLTSEPIGAGPFVMDSWVRDDRMRLSRNANWYDAPRPYLDTLEFRVVSDEDQRADTFLTGGAHVMFTTEAQQIARVTDESDGPSIITSLSMGQVLSFNTTKAPFDDARVRRAVAIGVDREEMAKAAEGESVDFASHFAVEGSPWFVEDAPVPEYDPEEAERLLSEYAADNGGPVRFTVSASPTNRNQQIAKFLQASLNQLDGIEVDVRTGDFPTFVGWALQGDFEMTIWGFPTIDPDPGLYNSIRGGVSTNIQQFANADIDDALDAARATDDHDERLELYSEVHRILAEELPFVPLTNTNHGYIASTAFDGLSVYEDGILRVDQLWRKS